MYMESRKMVLIKLLADSQREFLVWLRELRLGLWDNLEGVEGEREVQQGGDIYITMADSCWHMAETNTTV